LQALGHLPVFCAQAVSLLGSDFQLGVHTFRQKPGASLAALEVVDLVESAQFDQLGVDLEDDGP
jgi:hypothetical protein